MDGWNWRHKSNSVRLKSNSEERTIQRSKKEFTTDPHGVANLSVTLLTPFNTFPNIIDNLFIGCVSGRLEFLLGLKPN
ncbi:MAG: hypothetical protein HRT57_05200 [Crocinitomicaceae bacterium]|nr:hypothetical protein [Crocinitomicaceae bacterium]